MEIADFEKLVYNPRHGRPDIEQMMRNAITKNEPEYAHVAREALDERFPGWDNPSHKDARSRPTIARFRETEKEFPSAKQAYLWMTQRFIETYPSPFHNINWETWFVIKGRSRLYFARDPKRLFPKSPHLADDPNNFAMLNNGWYANLNLNNDIKLDILWRFAHLAKIDWNVDWSWQVLP